MQIQQAEYPLFYYNILLQISTTCKAFQGIQLQVLMKVWLLGNPKTSHDHYSKNVQLLNKLSLNKNISECAQNTMTYSKRVGTVTHFGVNDNQQQQCFFKSSNKIFKTVKTDQLLRDKVNRKLNISPLTNK